MTYGQCQLREALLREERSLVERREKPCQEQEVEKKIRRAKQQRGHATNVHNLTINSQEQTILILLLLSYLT